MKNSRIPYLFLCLLMAGATLTCSFFKSSNSEITSPEQKQATVASLQKTVQILEKTAVTLTVAPTTVLAFPTMIKPPSGSIAGLVSYPSEMIPALRVVAIKIDTGEFFATDVVDQKSYQLNGLPVGKYHVMAYLLDSAGKDPSLIGGYTKYVLCGLEASCSDHSLVDVEIVSGKMASFINPADWYAPVGTFPADPTK